MTNRRNDWMRDTSERSLWERLNTWSRPWRIVLMLAVLVILLAVGRII